ncbi:MAG: hypothetical protein E7626_06555 [Ruminococcaceae bacterium]|nr:hypothetical protein [Oscillospiraceae bacterium]
MKIKNYACTVVFLAFLSVFSLLLIFLPSSDFSQNEKRVLAEMPELTAESLSNGSYTDGLEKYINDHFPLRDTFVGIHSYYNRLIGRGNYTGIYMLSDGSLVSAPLDIDSDKCAKNLAALEKFADGTSLPASVIIVPSAGDVNKDKLPFGHENYADDEIFALANEKLGDVKLIDLRALFTEKEAAGEDIYYRTDHHVTSYGSYLMYLEYCKANSIEPTVGFENIEEIGGFYGTSYSKSGLWLTKPDVLEIWHSPNNYKFTVTLDDISEKKEQNGLYSYAHKENMDKYPIFLDGNHAITTIKNESVKNGKTLLVIKDSYAHCLSSFLCDQYETVCLVDPRYYRAGLLKLSQFADDIGATEILYVFGAENLATLSELALIR